MYIYYYYDPYKNWYRRQEINKAYAEIIGGPLAPEIKGIVSFIDVLGGTEVNVEVMGLPHYQKGEENKKPIGPHGFHLHENGSCVIGDVNNPFMEAGGHWNPHQQPHGNHAGDFPVLFSNNGYARMSFFTNKFRVADVLNKAIIIHEHPDDYESQPSGDAGRRLACGVIVEIN